MKTPIYTGIFQSDLDASGYKLIGLHTPVASSDAATKGYVDAHSGGGGGGASRKFDVMTYGAIGDGATDDTTAIQAALAAIPSTGGVLYFPAGQYEYTGSTLTLSKKVTVEGDGGAHELGGTLLSVSTIDFNSATGTLFDVKASGCSFKNIGLRNTSSTAPSAGAGILVSGNGTSYGGSNVGFESILVDSFYIGIDVQAGTAHCWHNCVISQPYLYGLKLRNILLPDGGDHHISNCLISGSGTHGATSAVRIESGGGIKIVNLKIVSGSNLWVNGIDLAVASGVQTSDLLISNCSIESCSSVGIKGTTSSGTSKWANIVLTGNQMSQITQNAIYMNSTTPGDFDGVTLTGNLGSYSPSPSYPMLRLINCSNIQASGNVMGPFPFSELITVDTCTWIAPTYIGADARLVPITGGVKLQVRNAGTGVWVDGDQWTNP